MNQLVDTNSSLECKAWLTLQPPGPVTKITRHYHVHYEMIYYLGRSMSGYIRGRKHVVRRHQLLLTEPYVIHRVTYPESEPADRIVVNFSESALDAVADLDVRQAIVQLFRQSGKRSAVLGFEPEQRREVERLLRLMVSESENPNPTSPTMLRLYLSTLLISFVRSQPFCSPATSGGAEEAIEQVAEVIHSGYDQPWSLAELADLVHLSRTHLCRCFHAVTGLGVVDYINQCRIAEAERLLLNSDLPVTEIGHRVGFSSDSYFIRTFRRVVGVTPGTYRGGRNSPEQ